MDNKKYMQLALEEAIKGRYQTHKDPIVGAIIVKDDQIIAQGHQDNFGQDHIIKRLISSLDSAQLQGATLYTNFEPCASFSEGGSCTDLIIKSGINQVVIGQTDPRGSHAVERLLDKKINVKVGILEKEARQLNQHFNYFYENGRPFITVKQTNSLDHMVSAANSPRVVLNNPAVINRIHLERANYQAIIIGSSTVIQDNPNLLTSVDTDFPPIRVILDRRGRLLNHQGLNALNDEKAPTWIFTENLNLKKINFKDHVRVFEMSTGTLGEVLDLLRAEEIQSLYVEGGPSVEKSFMDEGLVDAIVDYVKPIYFGEIGISGPVPSRSLDLENIKVETLDDNIRIAGDVKKPVKNTDAYTEW